MYIFELSKMLPDLWLKVFFVIHSFHYFIKFSKNHSSRSNAFSSMKISQMSHFPGSRAMERNGNFSIRSCNENISLNFWAIPSIFHLSKRRKHNWLLIITSTNLNWQGQKILNEANHWWREWNACKKITQHSFLFFTCHFHFSLDSDSWLEYPTQHENECSDFWRIFSFSHLFNAFD